MSSYGKNIVLFCLHDGCAGKNRSIVPEAGKHIGAGRLGQQQERTGLTAWRQNLPVSVEIFSTGVKKIIRIKRGVDVDMGISHDPVLVLFCPVYHFVFCVA